MNEAGFIIFKVTTGNQFSDGLKGSLKFIIRERLAFQEIKSYLEKYPGEKVALLYGAAHSFQNVAHGIWQHPPDKTY